MNTVSFSGPWWRKVLPPAVFVLAVSLLLQRPDAAAAPGADCDALLEKAAKADEIPEIIIDSATNSIRVRTSEGECVEQLSAPTEPSAAPGSPQTAPAPPPAAPPVAEAPEPKPSPAPSVTEAAKPAPAPAAPKTAEPGKPFETHPYFRREPVPPSGPRSLVAPRAEAAKAPAPPPAADCVGDLGALWKKGEHDIRGIRYRLSQVFTIDLDGDGRTDNVGFRLKASKTSDLVIRYFADPGHLAGRSVPTLKLDDEEVISGLCFGHLSFDTPRPKDWDAARGGVFETPNLAREMMAEGDTARRMKQGSAARPERGGTASTGLWAGIGAAAVFLVAAGGAGAYLTRRRWLPVLKRLGKARRKEGEEGEEEEEGEDEGEDGDNEE